MWDAAGQRWLSWGREVGTQALIKLVDDATPNQGTCMGIPLAQHAAMCEKRQANGNSWKSTTPIIITIPRAPFRAYVGVSFVRYQICLLWSRKLIMPTSKRLGFFFFSSTYAGLTMASLPCPRSHADKLSAPHMTTTRVYPPDASCLQLASAILPVRIYLRRLRALCHTHSLHRACSLESIQSKGIPAQVLLFCYQHWVSFSFS